MAKHRYHALDSLRGIASLQVLIAHSLVAIPSLSWIVFENKENSVSAFSYFLSHTPVSFLWSDSAAVKVFFVLSGFVLSLPYYEGKGDPHYLTYFVKRIIRLYIPCLVIILLSLLFRWILYKPDEVIQFGLWVKSMWTKPLTTDTFANLFFLTNYLDYFDRALWTLPPEIKLSLILPFAVYLLRPLTVVRTCIAVFCFTLVWHFLNKSGIRNVWTDYPVLYYFTFFLLGSVICKYKDAILTWMNARSGFEFTLLVTAAIFLYTFKYSIYWMPAKLQPVLGLLTEYISAVAVLMLCIVLSERTQFILQSRILTFLGKISFSLYLIHIVVIAVFAYVLQNYFLPEVVVGVAAVCSLPLAVLYYKYVELPSLRFAKFCSKNLIKYNLLTKPS